MLSISLPLDNLVPRKDLISNQVELDLEVRHFFKKTRQIDFTENFREIDFYKNS